MVARPGRGTYEPSDLGRYSLIVLSNCNLVAGPVDPEKLGGDLGVLTPGELVSDACGRLTSP